VERKVSDLSSKVSELGENGLREGVETMIDL
jgi:hypothetical protein